eukprot:scaffold1277_cov253-Pinguiococcus_pyrenoidosus.AAC.18
MEKASGAAGGAVSLAGRSSFTCREEQFHLPGGADSLAAWSRFTCRMEQIHLPQGGRDKRILSSTFKCVGISSPLSAAFAEIALPRIANPFLQLRDPFANGFGDVVSKRLQQLPQPILHLQRLAPLVAAVLARIPAELVRPPKGDEAQQEYEQVEDQEWGNREGDQEHRPADEGRTPGLEAPQAGHHAEAPQDHVREGVLHHEENPVTVVPDTGVLLLQVRLGQMDVEDGLQLRRQLQAGAEEQALRPSLGNDVAVRDHGDEHVKQKHVHHEDEAHEGGDRGVPGRFVLWGGEPLALEVSEKHPVAGEQRLADAAEGPLVLLVSEVAVVPRMDEDEEHVGESQEHDAQHDRKAAQIRRDLQQGHDKGRELPAQRLEVPQQLQPDGQRPKCRHNAERRAGAHLAACDGQRCQRQR